MWPNEEEGAGARPVSPAELLMSLSRRHVIRAVPSGRGWIDAHCGVALVRNASGARPLGWRHDPAAVRLLREAVE